MDYFYNVLVNSLKCQKFWVHALSKERQKSLSLIKNILIYVLLMNKDLIGLEHHEGE